MCLVKVSDDTRYQEYLCNFYSHIFCVSLSRFSETQKLDLCFSNLLFHIGRRNLDCMYRIHKLKHLIHGRQPIAAAVVKDVHMLSGERAY